MVHFFCCDVMVKSNGIKCILPEVLQYDRSRLIVYIKTNSNIPAG